MTQLTIEVSLEELKQLEAMAAARGQSVRDLLIGNTLGAIDPDDEEAAWEEFQALILERSRQADQEGPSSKTVQQVYDEVLQRVKARDHGESPAR